MSTYVLIPGAGSTPWFWHRVVPLLEARGHDVVTPELPCDDPDAGLRKYAQAVLEAVGDREDLVVVAQSLGGLTAPLVCAQRPALVIIYVNGMVPLPGESDWFRATGTPEIEGDFDPVRIFLHDVPDDVVAASAEHVRPQAGRPMEEPWPLAARPDVPERFVLSRDDRFFPAGWMRGVVSERLGTAPVEIGGGHCPSLSRPDELVEVLERLRSEVAVVEH